MVHLSVVLGGVKFGGSIFFPPTPGDEVGRATVRLDDVGLDRSFQGLAGCFREYIAHYTFLETDHICHSFVF